MPAPPRRHAEAINEPLMVPPAAPSPRTYALTLLRDVGEHWAADLVGLGPQLTAGQQRALVDLARELAGVPLDTREPGDRAGDLIVIAEQALALSKQLLDGVDQDAPNAADEMER